MPAEDEADWRGELRTAVVCLVVLVLAGAPLGLLWAAVAPHALVLLTADGPRLASPETDAFIAADACLLALGLGAGVVAGLLAWRGAATHRPGATAGLGLGGSVGMLVAATVGHRVGRAAFRAALAHPHPGALVAATVRVRAPTVLLGLPFAAVVTVALLAFLERPSTSSRG